MATYLVGYDMKEGQSYTALIEYLTSLRTVWHCLDSTWLVKTSLSETELRDQCWSRMKSNDRLLVLRYVTHTEVSTGSAAWAGFTGDCQSWLKRNT